MRLDKWLHDIGLGSRKDIGKMLRGGRITVDGALCRDKSKQVTDKTLIELDGKSLKRNVKAVLLMNKPSGVITAVRDKELPTVVDLLPEEWQARNMLPIGRLDRDTTGLLLFSADGELIHRLSNPRYHVAKRYLVHYDGKLPENAAIQVAQGLRLNDGVTMPGELLDKGEGIAELTIYEGRNHQVKRMFIAMGTRVVSLARLSYGALELPEDLPLGASIVLSEEAQRALYDAVNLS